MTKKDLLEKLDELASDLRRMERGVDDLKETLEDCVSLLENLPTEEEEITDSASKEE